MAKIMLPLLELYLDKENPRHNVIDDQDKIIEHLVRREDIRALAKNIAERGEFSPLDAIGVIKEGSLYVVVEGNRRTCAGILLNDPNRSPKGEQKYFRSLVDKSDRIPHQIECHIFNDRESAREWIDIRHNGPQGGIGTVPWNADQKARFFNNSGTALALAILDYAVKGGMLSEENREKKVLTTAARYLNNPDFRKAIGVVSSRSDPQVMINVTVDDFNKVISRFCNDLIDPQSDVSSRSNKEDWMKYIEKLKSEGDAPKSTVSAQALDSTLAKKVSPSSPKPRNNLSSDYRQTIIDNSTFKVIIKEKLLKRTFDELRQIDCNKFPLAAVIVCRIFLENIYKSYHEREISRVNDSEEVHITLQKIIRHIEQLKAAGVLDRGQKKALGALARVASNTMNVLSPKTLGAFAHGGHYPEPRSIKIEWDNIADIILFMLNTLAKK
ncbi:ParB N-terminal domain-containing protein [Pseudomonas syringae pv. aptata]|uniref:ParB N-terminal domain-containing protein n=1 Tax=Pseudomonas syringae TaxID=317 RepID=UPI00203EDACE|nr:ParB N-terminal domain-containing protein [Pseudomonas syringae]MCK0545827.1 ParB N-terminal domain-containing protein [Pseudomonas syringae pv. aptata]